MPTGMLALGNYDWFIPVSGITGIGLALLFLIVNSLYRDALNRIEGPQVFTRNPDGAQLHVFQRYVRQLTLLYLPHPNPELEMKRRWTLPTLLAGIGWIIAVTLFYLKFVQ